LAFYGIIDMMISHCCLTRLHSPEGPLSYLSEVWQSVTHFHLTICKI